MKRFLGSIALVAACMPVVASCGSGPVAIAPTPKANVSTAPAARCPYLSKTEAQRITGADFTSLKVTSLANDGNKTGVAGCSYSSPTDSSLKEVSFSLYVIGKSRFDFSHRPVTMHQILWLGACNRWLPTPAIGDEAYQCSDQDTQMTVRFGDHVIQLGLPNVAPDGAKKTQEVLSLVASRWVPPKDLKHK